MRLNDTSSTDGNRMVIAGVQFMYVPPTDPPQSHTVTLEYAWQEVPAEHDLYAWNAGPPAWPWPPSPRELGTRGREAPEPETPPPKREGPPSRPLLQR